VSPFDGEAVVRVQGLRKRFGTLEVLTGIDMEVRRGEVGDRDAPPAPTTPPAAMLMAVVFVAVVVLVVVLL
jgi:hypothetical protein